MSAERNLDFLGDAPLDETTEADDFADRCQALATDPPTEFAYDTLLGIASTVRTSGRVTSAQRQAVRNIVMAAQEKADRGPRGGSRRYEGWSRR